MEEPLFASSSSIVLSSVNASSSISSSLGVSSSSLTIVDKPLSSNFDLTIIRDVTFKMISKTDSSFEAEADNYYCSENTAYKQTTNRISQYKLFDNQLWIKSQYRCFYTVFDSEVSEFNSTWTNTEQFVFDTFAAPGCDSTNLSSDLPGVDSLAIQYTFSDSLLQFHQTVVYDCFVENPVAMVRFPTYSWDTDSVNTPDCKTLEVYHTDGVKEIVKYFDDDFNLNIFYTRIKDGMSCSSNIYDVLKYKSKEEACSYPNPEELQAFEDCWEALQPKP